MANGMIGLWFDLKIPKIIAKGCGHQTIIHAKLCFFMIPDKQSVYAVVHSTKTSNHDNDSILFERWEMEYSMKTQQNGERSISPMFHVVDVDTFGSPILAIEDYNISQLSTNTESAMVSYSI